MSNTLQKRVEEDDDIVFTVDNRGYFRYVNKAGIKASGYFFNKLSKLRYVDLVKPGYKQKVQHTYLKQYLERNEISNIEQPFKQSPEK